MKKFKLLENIYSTSSAITILEEKIIIGEIQDEELYLDIANRNYTLEISNRRLDLYLNLNEVQKLDVVIQKNSYVKIHFFPVKNTIKCDFSFSVYKGSKLSLNSIVLGEKIELCYTFHLIQEFATVWHQVLNVSKENNQAFITSQINHLAKNTTSEVLKYAIAKDMAQVTLFTISKIAKGCAKSNARQLSKGILTSKKAVIKAKPILEIDEFDVKCYHGASVGKISEDSLYYLMSRGLNEDEAKKLIIHGFINKFIADIKNQDLKYNIIDSINHNL